MTTGEQLRMDGLAANLAAQTAPHRDYREHAERVLAEFVRERREFTADDVHRQLPDDIKPQSTKSPNVIPSLIGSYSAQKVIVPVGWANSTRPSRHASRNRIWTARCGTSEVVTS